MNRVKKMFVLPFMILSFLTLPLKAYAVDNVPEPTAAPVTTGITTTVIDDIPESTAAPVTTDITTTVIDDIPESTAAPVTTDITTTVIDDVPEPTAAPVTTENTTATTPVTTDITTTENTVVITSIPIVTSISPITSLYQRAYHLDINNLPNKTNYNIGDELDLTGLKVDLTYNDESNIYHNTDYINAYPLDYPDVFTVDTSKFDNSKAGTYTIEISCKYEYLHWFLPSAYLKVTVNDSGSSTTTTSTSTTDITTTETTTVTTEADTEQTTAPTTDAGGNITTETSTVPPTTTTGTETTLPQTGYSQWYRAIIPAAMGMVGVGLTAIVRSGIFRKKESNS